VFEIGLDTAPRRWEYPARLAHNLGFAEGNASFRVFIKAQRAGTKRAKEKGYEVLYLVDPVDELLTQSLNEYAGKKHISPDDLEVGQSVKIIFAANSGQILELRLMAKT